MMRKIMCEKIGWHSLRFESPSFFGYQNYRCKHCGKEVMKWGSVPRWYRKQTEAKGDLYDVIYRYRVAEIDVNTGQVSIKNRDEVAYSGKRKWVAVALSIVGNFGPAVAYCKKSSSPRMGAEEC